MSDVATSEQEAIPEQDEGRSFAPRPKKRDVHGWVVLDKPVGMTSTHAVAVVKRAFSAKKAGHAGTLDPLASGLLPIALGEATKTVPFVMDGRKAYQFTVAWGSQTNTDDTEGKVIATSEARPDEAAIAALLPRFTGTISQVPPQFSAIKISGERAYDLAREGATVDIRGTTGTVERVGARQALIRLTAPVPGMLSVYAWGEGSGKATAGVRAYLFSADAADYVRREEPAWQDWLQGLSIRA